MTDDRFDASEYLAAERVLKAMTDTREANFELHCEIEGVPSMDEAKINFDERTNLVEARRMLLEEAERLMQEENPR